MKAMKILLGVALVVSVGLNVWLWQQHAAQLAATENARTVAAETEAMRGEIEALKTLGAASPTESEADTRELARLRNEVGQLRRQVTEANAARVSETALLRAQLAAAQKALAATEGNLAEVAKLNPEESAALKQEAQAVQCVNHLKQIGVSASLWANDHGNTFPPDVASMWNQLVTPKILFCPAAPGGIQAATWEELNLATISYQFLNLNGSANDPQKPLTFCPIHNITGYSDGSVQRDRKPSAK